MTVNEVRKYLKSNLNSGLWIVFDVKEETKCRIVSDAQDSTSVVCYIRPSTALVLDREGWFIRVPLVETENYKVFALNREKALNG